MNEDERYLFDLNSYLALRTALGADEVAEFNRAIEHHIDELTEIDRSLAGGSKALYGTSRRLGLSGMLAPGNGPGVSPSATSSSTPGSLPTSTSFWERDMR